MIEQDKLLVTRRVSRGKMPTVRGTRAKSRLLPFSKWDGQA